MNGLKRSRLSLSLILALSVYVLSSLSVSAQQFVAPKSVETPDISGYVIKVGDIVSINIEGYEDYDRTVTVEEDGRISYGAIGKIKAAGLTVSQLKEEIADTLKPYISNPKVKISIKQQEYIIKPGDVVNITVEGNEDYNQTEIVQRNGKITYMSLGEIQAAGLTTSQLEENLKQALQAYIISPKVKVSIGQEGYIIKPGDTIDIVVPGNESYNQSLVVQQSGKISHKLLGDIQVAGLSVSQVEEKLRLGLQSYISEPQVRVSIRKGEVPIEEIPIEEKKVEEIKPEKKEYIINPDDVIDIVVRDHGSYNRTVVVRSDGKVLYPPLGEFSAAGLTEEQLSREIAVKLSGYINNPQVRVVVKGRLDLGKVQFSEISKYLIKPGDVINIRVEGRDGYDQTVEVQPNGKISYAPLGEVKIQAAGLTEDQLSGEIAERLGNRIRGAGVKASVVKGKDIAKPESLEGYIIKAGDVIQVTVDGYENYNQVSVVQPNGTFPYAPLGEISAAGLAPSELAGSIRSRLSTIINNPQVRISIRQFKKVPEEVQRVEVEAPAPLKRFGYDFFVGARNRILKLEETGVVGPTGEAPPISAKDAISGFVGPIDMMSANVVATAPSTYVLGPGDRITIHFWSDVLELQTASLVVDDKGEVIIPPKSTRMVVRGMTLSQFQEAAREELSRVAYKNLKLIASLDRLRSIQIFITGEAFRPGSYAVSAVSTLFNALYMCGGPSDNGSLRDIKLLRNNETKTIDFYKFLMSGDSSQDFNLLAGDTIFIPPVGRTATIGGEVRRPAVYELKEEENLKELVSLAGGIRPSGYLQRVRIDSVDPSRKRIVLDVDLSAPDQTSAPIFDGDTVTVFSIPSERVNTVTIEGKVQMPGVYQLKEGMKVADLIQSAQGALGEAYMERADLLRLNPDRKTTRLIPINLSKALSGDDNENINLEQWDKLIVYSKWDIKWTADRVVNIHGAVQRPGTYERSDGMTVYDLLIRAGGTLPSAYMDRAGLLRLDERGNLTKSFPINLGLAMQKKPENNIELKDGDTLLVYTYQEARWEPERKVMISGAVQNPNLFTRTEGMKVSDLIETAGGLLPSAYTERALLLRLDERQEATQGFFINLKLALQDDPQNNLELKDGDELKVYTYKEAVWEPKKEVTVTGAVQNPNTFEKVDGMRVSDLIHRAGGVLPNAYLERADIRRFRPDYETFLTIPVNLAKALSGDKTADVPLEAGDLLNVYTLREAEYRPKNIVTIYGAVQRPDTYIRTFNMKLSDLLFAAGGILPGAYKNAEIARIGDDGKPVVLTVDVIALLKGDTSQDIPLEDEDVVSIRKQREFLDSLRVARLVGEVKYPGDYVLKPNERLSDLIKRAGGLTDRAYPEAAVVTRRVENLVLDEQRQSMRQVKKLFEDLSQQEYLRESARAWLVQRERAPAQLPTSTTGAPTGVLGALGGTTELATIASIPEQTQAMVSGVEEMARLQYTIVTPARRIDSFLPPGRVGVNVEEALARPGVKDDIVLEDGDTITIPVMPNTISITGAVVQPSSVVYIQGKKPKDYIEMVGGYSADADEKAVYVVKANGMVTRGDKAKLSPGDVIVVPTKVMVQKVTDRWGQMISAIRFTVTTLATVYIIKLIIGRI